MAGNAPPFWRALMLAFEAPAKDKLRPTDEQLVGMSWRLAREACGLTPPLMDGYRADGPLDDLRLPPTLPPGAGQAAQKFLREHWRTPGAVPWYNIAKNIDEDTGMSGELGLPNSSQHDCRLCLRCIRREASAAVGKPAETGLITQKAATGKGGHLKSKAHERAKQEYARQQQAVSAAREQAHRQGVREGGAELLRKQRKRHDKNKRRHGRTKDVLSDSLLDGASTCTELTEESRRARTQQRARVGGSSSSGDQEVTKVTDSSRLSHEQYRPEHEWGGHRNLLFADAQRGKTSPESIEQVMRDTNAVFADVRRGQIRNASTASLSSRRSNRRRGAGSRKKRKGGSLCNNGRRR
jgi:hypothetical protein